MSDSPLADALIITFLLFITTMCVGWIGSAQNPSVGDDLLKLFEKEVAGQIIRGEPR